jgi:V-type H+-transporting ATPase subunit d
MQLDNTLQVGEFNYIRRQATGELATFMEFITWDYLIKSVSFVISSLIRGNDPSTLLEKCHPLGRSPHLRNVTTFENQVRVAATALHATPASGGNCIAYYTCMHAHTRVQ